MPVAAIILAAGLSTRMGRNKLVEPIDGQAMVRHVAEAALASRARPAIVVVGNDATSVRAALQGLTVRIVENPGFREGLSASIRAGVSATPEDSDGALILPGDMPGISAKLIDRVIVAARGKSDCAICVACRRGQRGHPVLFGRRYFPDLLALSGDVGARSVIAGNEAHVCDVEAGDDSPLADIDNAEDLARFRQARR